MPADKIVITVRYAGATYLARARGQKTTASCTISALQAAVAMTRKLGLNPALLKQESRPEGIPTAAEIFSHPGLSS